MSYPFVKRISDNVNTPSNEAERLAALARYAILDTPADIEFDEFARLASGICNAPIALIGFIDGDRNWIKSQVGFDVTESPRDVSFCAHTILGQELLEVSNTLYDERFNDNFMVTGTPHLRFYAGMPLVTADGFSIGSVCVAGRAPRSLTPQQRDALAILARQIMKLLDSRLAATRQIGEFEQRIVERAAELSAAREAAEQASSAKSVFLANMSHEIRTPVNSVFSMLERLSLTKLNSEQNVRLDLVRESGKVLLRVIDDILDFSKIEVGKLDVRVEVVSIAQLIGDVYAMYSLTAAAKGLLMTRHCDEKISAALMLDPLRLRQILENFVINALKFGSRGSIRIQAEFVGRTNKNETIKFSVENTGISVDVESEQRLFQAFSQAESDITGINGGTGLGLAVSRRLAELMGGAIEIVSAADKGTTMMLTLTLPIADPGQLPKASAESARDVLSAMPGARRNSPSVVEAEAEGTLVLIVDDNMLSRKVLQFQLHTLGYAALHAVDGADGLRQWRSGRFGMVITDCSMPVMDGYEFARSVRRDEAASGKRRTPIIASAANPPLGESASCLAAGMDYYMTKPTELAHLLEKLDKWLPLPRLTKTLQAAAGS